MSAWLELRRIGKAEIEKSVIICRQIKMKCYTLFQGIIQDIHMISVKQGFV